MASTSVTLGPHWDEFIALMLKEGRYGSTSELIRASLRLMEEQEGQRARLRNGRGAAFRAGAPLRTLSLMRNWY